jgi:hypothetical protein
MMAALLLLMSVCAESQQMPLPWTRELSVQSPALQGKDVLILQQLLGRDGWNLTVDSVFGDSTAAAVRGFQSRYGLHADGVLGQPTALVVLSQCGSDGYRDINGSAAAAYLQQYSVPHKYKVVVPVHHNRSMETTASLFDANDALMLSFTVRAHGHRNDTTTYPWPDFSNEVGRTQFYSNGNTPTGVMAFDLNSPEPNPLEYGPYPVNRAVIGLALTAHDPNPHPITNARIILDPAGVHRGGILMHTGNWSSASNWKPDLPMPNSAGCIHAHPHDIQQVWQLLVGIGVEVSSFSLDTVLPRLF